MIARRLLVISLLLSAIATPIVSAQSSAPLSARESDDFSRLLAVAGWDDDRLATLARDGPPSTEENPTERTLELLKLLHRLKSFGAANLDGWSRELASLDELRNDPAAYRGTIFRLEGRAVGVTRRDLAPADAARLEMSHFVRCDMQLADHLATVIVEHVPRKWSQIQPLDEPTSCVAMFINRPEHGSTQPVFLATRLAWHPEHSAPPTVSFGESVLGILGFDVGLYDVVQNRHPLRDVEREAFYQLLHAVGQIGAHQLARSAQGNLSQVVDSWRSVLRRQSSGEGGGDRNQQLLAREVIRRAEEDRFSVAPLFNDADNQSGRLVVLDGVARRIVKIDVGRAPDGTPSDIYRRFGIDHYYEMEIFTDDSQNYPIVFCVRELPAGLPVGDQLHQPVRVAGFFFKTWRYHPRQANSPGQTGTRQQVAPLLVGRAPLPLDPGGATAGAHHGLIGGLTFVAAVAAVWLAAWWYARGDREFRRRTRHAQYRLPAGQSLDDLVGEPDPADRR